MKITSDILKSSGAILFLAMAGCVPQSAYHAYEAGGDSFAMNDKYLRVDPLDYPVFSSVRNIKGPTPGYMEDRGWRYPEISREYKWVVSHAFDGKYLVYSKEYDYEYCLFAEEWAKLPEEICKIEEPSLLGPQGKGARSNIYVYMREDGSAYGFQFLRNPKRWVLKSDKVSFFRVSDRGDWSGQPWFKCVERCEKLVNMMR
ncbi:hypothetical protein [Stutzerimonas tarimensis]|uniref:Lipoprotein n=1 Tax=Stutzerimonas tarimensis TaxID=1507735 RepID=A0ABV7T469_9GAMM